MRRTRTLYFLDPLSGLRVWAVLAGAKTGQTSIGPSPNAALFYDGSTSPRESYQPNFKHVSNDAERLAILMRLRNRDALWTDRDDKYTLAAAAGVVVCCALCLLELYGSDMAKGFPGCRRLSESIFF